MKTTQPLVLSLSTARLSRLYSVNQSSKSFFFLIYIHSTACVTLENSGLHILQGKQEYGKNHSEGVGDRSAITLRGQETSVWPVARVRRGILRHQGTTLYQGNPEKDIALTAEQISSTLTVS